MRIRFIRSLCQLCREFKRPLQFKLRQLISLHKTTSMPMWALILYLALMLGSRLLRNSRTTLINRKLLKAQLLTNRDKWKLWIYSSEATRGLKTLRDLLNTSLLCRHLLNPIIDRAWVILGLKIIRSWYIMECMGSHYNNGGLVILMAMLLLAIIHLNQFRNLIKTLNKITEIVNMTKHKA